ncbi:DUF1062 domain-containing protein [Saccharothrix variisporea]|uniref:DUF1062 domain-containing protein n=1 Tax=Saccharothrix variisporea TaxID=543527 RepID=A0A495X0W9_9PSEU|nr:DUF1062 domain-containing protein [Saccharothrix variisporea]RKT66905.1 hypothetical protein DFJ66_0070 [Saccharothrix variisporea]
MNSSVLVGGERPEVDRKALWVVRELGLPVVVRACVSCRGGRHRATGKVRVNASGKLLDVWLLIGCEQCGRTSKVPVHERTHVGALDHDLLVRYQDNDPGIVRQLVMDAGLAGRAKYRLDWSGTWELSTDLPFHEFDPERPLPLEVVVRFELPVPVRVRKLLTAGFGVGRAVVQGLVDAGRVLLPVPLDGKVREDFTFFVVDAEPEVRPCG